MRKNPSSLLVMVRLKPAPKPVVVVPLAVAAFVIVNVILGTNAPALSLTLPSMLPVVSCPKASEQVVSRITTRRNALGGLSLCMGRLLIENDADLGCTKADIDRSKSTLPNHNRRFKMAGSIDRAGR